MTVEARLTRLLAGGNRDGGFPTSLVCTDGGLLVAAAGADDVYDHLAALASIFDDVVLRAARDLSMGNVDELAIRDQHVGRYVIRPLRTGEDRRMFLVVHVPPGASWRRTTNRLCVGLEAELKSILGDREVS